MTRKSRDSINAATLAIFSHAVLLLLITWFLCWYRCLLYYMNELMLATFAQIVEIFIANVAF